MMKIVGLTGGIASGKSTVTNRLRDHHGMAVLDMDEISRGIMKVGAPTYERVKKAFSDYPEIFDEQGEIVRRNLGDLIFRDPSLRALLNSLTHPAIQKELFKQLVMQFVKGSTLVFIDSPLLFEGGLNKITSKVVVVYVNEETQLSRLLGRDVKLGIAQDEKSEENARNRINSQMSLEKKREMANIVIDNNGSLEDLHKQIDKAVEKLKPSQLSIALSLTIRYGGILLLLWLLLKFISLLFF